MSVKSMNFILLFFIRVYKAFISPLLGQNCRYYPSCSSYASWLLENENFFKASLAIMLRILRCNQLFSGGIEYPIVKKNIVKNNLLPNSKSIKFPSFWLVPYKNKKFYLIKNIRTNPSV